MAKREEPSDLMPLSAVETTVEDAPTGEPEKEDASDATVIGVAVDVGAAEARDVAAAVDVGGVKFFAINIEGDAAPSNFFAKC